MKLDNKYSIYQLTSIVIFTTTLLTTLITNAEDTAFSKGIGPVKELKLEALSLDLATKGKQIFTAKCSACHKMTERYVGPNLGDVFKRRTPEWIANMILNPAEMIKSDPAAMDLFAEYLVPMTFQDLNLDDTKAIIEYFRYYSEKGEIADTKKPTTKKTKK